VRWLCTAVRRRYSPVQKLLHRAENLETCGFCWQNPTAINGMLDCGMQRFAVSHRNSLSEAQRPQQATHAPTNRSPLAGSCVAFSTTFRIVRIPHKEYDNEE
jgi:hypothetical protein